ncbi:MAG TPA: hypothetical protein VLB76_22260 [Thermoanaerobaculia bacterium]|jgi:hypothetical protein|nr:hypothetical protein [Thermoanaerobaculia bacterium]
MHKFARIAGLSLILSITSLAAFADPPAPPVCSCSYCAHASTNRSCTLDGATTTCGAFLSFTTCGPVG